MKLRNTQDAYGWLSIALHWLTAVAVIGLFSVGLWMEGLDYDHPLYKLAPHWHKSIGVLLILLIAFRFVWRLSTTQPNHHPNHKSWERMAAGITHYALYGLLFLMLPTGYLITTAKGQSLEVFNWFSIPSFIQGIPNLEDIAGEVHETMAFIIIGLAIFHAVGALKHHFIDRDNTLTRMLGTTKSDSA